MGQLEYSIRVTRVRRALPGGDRTHGECGLVRGPCRLIQGPLLCGDSTGRTLAPEVRSTFNGAVTSHNKDSDITSPWSPLSCRRRASSVWSLGPLLHASLLRYHHRLRRFARATACAYDQVGIRHCCAILNPALDDVVDLFVWVLMLLFFVIVNLDVVEIVMVAVVAVILTGTRQFPRCIFSGVLAEQVCFD